VKIDKTLMEFTTLDGVQIRAEQSGDEVNKRRKK
jgi:hypothetical protein